MVSYLLILIPSLLFVCLLVVLFVFLFLSFSLFLSLTLRWLGEEMGVRGCGGGESVTAISSVKAQICMLTTHLKYG